jgi:hypothetical protein
VRRQLDQPPGEDGEHAGQVLGVPGPGLIGLAEADQAVGAEPGEELDRAHQPHDRRVRSAAPAEPASGRTHHAQRQPRHDAGEETPRHPRLDPGGRDAHQVGPAMRIHDKWLSGFHNSHGTILR